MSRCCACCKVCPCFFRKKKKVFYDCSNSEAAAAVSCEPCRSRPDANKALKGKKGTTDKCELTLAVDLDIGSGTAKLGPCRSLSTSQTLPPANSFLSALARTKTHAHTPLDSVACPPPDTLNDLDHTVSRAHSAQFLERLHPRCRCDPPCRFFV